METKEKTIEELLSDVHLNWTVRTEDIQTVSGIIIPGKMSIVREDNDLPLGIHSKGYVPYQNSELMELLTKISQKTGLEIHSGGQFGGGEKVWIQLKSADLTIGNDKVKGYISGFNSFDGSTSLGFGNSNTTVSCQNTFWKAYVGVQTKVRHSITMAARIETVLLNIDQLLKEEQHTFKEIERLGTIRMTPEIKEMVIRKMFDLKAEERLDSPEFSTRKRNAMDRFYIDLDSELKSKDDSLWGLFSGVTKYTTHSMRKGDNTVAKIFGSVGVKEREIWNELVSVA